MNVRLPGTRTESDDETVVWSLALLTAVPLMDNPTVSGAKVSVLVHQSVECVQRIPLDRHDSDSLDSRGIVPYFENPTTAPLVALDGLMWLKKSSGTWSNGSQYELFDPTAAGWLLHTTISVQTATGWQIVEDAQVNDCGYAGYFNGRKPTCHPT